MRPALALLALLACTAPVAAKKPPRISHAPALPADPAPPRPADGSIFNVQAGYAALVEGTRARAVGDPVTIVLIEQTTTAKSAGGKTQRSGSGGIVPPSAGPLAFLNPDALKASSDASFNGGGSASQTSSLSGELTVTIAEVRAGGTALVRGEKQMWLSQGEEWIQFSGIVRLADISPDNRIVSSRVADARIEYAGKGQIQRASRPGWLSRFFNAVSPF